MENTSDPVQYVGGDNTTNPGFDWNSVWGKVLDTGLSLGKSALDRQLNQPGPTNSGAQKDVRDLSWWDKLKDSPALLIGGGVAVALVLWLVIKRR